MTICYSLMFIFEVMDASFICLDMYHQLWVGIGPGIFQDPMKTSWEYGASETLIYMLSLTLLS